MDCAAAIISSSSSRSCSESLLLQLLSSSDEKSDKCPCSCSSCCTVVVDVEAVDNDSMECSSMGLMGDANISLTRVVATGRSGSTVAVVVAALSEVDRLGGDGGGVGCCL